MGAGRAPRAGNLADRWPPGGHIAAPLRLHQTTVGAEWVDYNDHLSEWAYLLVFGDGADALFRFLGVDEAYRAAGQSLYTAETHLRHLREVKLGEQLAVTLQVLGHDAKRLHVLHEMHAASVGCAATAEQLLLHVDTGAGRVVPFPGQLAGRLRQVADAHTALPVPGYVGRPIRPPARELDAGRGP
jgi:acyl-CoA thioester hydrolase